MHDPAAEELELALRRCCDEVLSDVTIPTSDGLVRRAHWRYRGREFRATVPVLAALADRTYADWRRHGQHFAHLPAPATFEARADSVTWDVVANVSYWRWLLTTAGRRRGGNDESVGGAAGLPVRPLPAPPSLRAGAAALSEPALCESRRHNVLSLRQR